MTRSAVPRILMVAAMVLGATGALAAYARTPTPEAPAPTESEAAVTLASGPELAAAPQQGQAVTLICHKRGKRGAKGFEPRYVNGKALKGHRGHGDVVPGDPYPDLAGWVYGEDCAPTIDFECPCFAGLDVNEIVAFAEALDPAPGDEVCEVDPEFVQIWDKRFTTPAQLLIDVTNARAVSNRFCRYEQKPTKSAFVSGLTESEAGTCMAEAALLAQAISWCNP